MIGYYVPHAVYSDDYHCDPKIPLSFMNFTSKKIQLIYITAVFILKKELYDLIMNQYHKHRPKN